MRQRQTNLYGSFLRSNIKEPDLETRKLSPEQILSLKYQCAVENKDFETAKTLRSLMIPADKKTKLSESPLTARQQAE
jgi:hypothetical protein